MARTIAWLVQDHARCKTLAEQRAYWLNLSWQEWLVYYWVAIRWAVMGPDRLGALKFLSVLTVFLVVARYVRLVRWITACLRPDDGEVT